MHTSLLLRIEEIMPVNFGFRQRHTDSQQADELGRLSHASWHWKRAMQGDVSSDRNADLPYMREKLRPVLFTDDDQESAAAARKSFVAPAQRSESAKPKDTTRRTADGFPVQSFHDILQDLGTLCRNRIRTPEFDSEFNKLTLATAYQQHVLNLLGATTK